MSQVAANAKRVALDAATFGGYEVYRAGKNYIEGQTKKAQDAADQAAAEQAAANDAASKAGPESIPLREQFFAEQAGAAGAMRSGNESDIAGTSLFAGPRKRAASRTLYG